MKISMSTFVYFRYPLLECLKRLKQIGYDGVELWGGRPHAYYEDMTDDRIARVKDALETLDLEISNFIPAQFRYPTNIACTDEQIRKNSVTYIKRNMDVAERLGSPYISICPGYSMYGDTLEHAHDAMNKSLDELIQYAKPLRTRLLMEPAHPMETDLICTVGDALRMIGRVGRENMGLCVDLGHLAVNKENISETVNIVNGHTVHYHIDDNNGNDDQHLIPGDGSIAFEPFLSNLKRSGYDGFLAVELGYPYTADPDAASCLSLQRMKDMINGR